MVTKILTVFGARPQFIKGATVSRALREREDIEEIIVHTGQHFDNNMSEVFFQQMNIPKPKYNLGVSGLDHGAMTGRMLEGIEGLIKLEKPNWVLVYGDTNSTIAGTLAASKLHVPVAHVEAGLRSHNPNMPEEINRVLTDRISTLLLCPTETAVKNLKSEGYPFPSNTISKRNMIQRIENIGDVMYDSVMYYRQYAQEKVSLERFGLKHKNFVLCTVHRQENTDNASNLNNIVCALRAISKDLPVVLPLHPRTKAKIQEYHRNDALNGLTVIDPIPYLEMQRLQMSASLIITDSGGMQKEAYFHQVPCLTLRNETEWVETVEVGWNQLVGINIKSIINAAQNAKAPQINQTSLYGDGRAAYKVIEIITE